MTNFSEQQQYELIKGIPLIKNLLDDYEGINEVNIFELKHIDQDMLNLYLKFHSNNEVTNIDDDMIVRYINFIEFTGLNEGEYKIICKYINKYNFVYLVTKDIFTNEFVRESLIPLLHYDVINYCLELETNTKYDNTLWFEKWSINNYKWLAKNTTVLNRHKVFEYKGVYYHKINGVIYSNVTDVSMDILNDQFIYAIDEENVEIMKYLIDNGADVRYRNDKGIRSASRVGNVGIVKYLCERGADIHAEQEESLIFSSIHGHIEVFKYLVEKGADITTQSNFVIMCCSNLEIIKFIVKVGGDIHVREDELLMRAVNSGDMNIIKYLVEENAVINAQDGKALLLAVKNEDLGVLKFLVERGANVKVRNNEAIVECIKKGNLEMFEYLISKGADIKTRDDETIARLGTQCFIKGNKEISEYLRKTVPNVQFKKNFVINNKKLIVSRSTPGKKI